MQFPGFAHAAFSILICVCVVCRFSKFKIKFRDFRTFLINEKLVGDAQCEEAPRTKKRLADEY